VPSRGEKRCVDGFSGEEENLEYAGVDGRIILKWMLEKWDLGAWTGPIWLRVGTDGGLLCIR
jgi:hypothetical protein